MSNNLIRDSLKQLKEYFKDRNHFCQRTYFRGDACCIKGASNDPVQSFLEPLAWEIVHRERAKGTDFNNCGFPIEATCPLVLVNDGLGYDFVMELINNGITILERRILSSNGGSGPDQPLSTEVERVN